MCLSVDFQSQSPLENSPMRHFPFKCMIYKDTIKKTKKQAQLLEVALCYITSRLIIILNSEKDTKIYIHTTLFLGLALLKPPRITPEVDLYRYLTRRVPSWSHTHINTKRQNTQQPTGTRAYWSRGMINTNHPLCCHSPSTKNLIYICHAETLKRHR